MESLNSDNLDRGIEWLTVSNSFCRSRNPAPVPTDAILTSLHSWMLLLFFHSFYVAVKVSALRVKDECIWVVCFVSQCSVMFKVHTVGFFLSVWDGLSWPLRCLWDVAVFHTPPAQPTIAPALSLPPLKFFWGVFKIKRQTPPSPLPHPCSAWMFPPLFTLPFLCTFSFLNSLSPFLSLFYKVPTGLSLGLTPGQLLSKSLSQPG